MRASLDLKLAGLLYALLLIGAGAGVALTRITSDTRVATWVLAVAGLLLATCVAAIVLRPVRRLLSAMSGLISSYRDGDFSTSLVVDRDDELGELLVAHNDLGKTLREQRSQLLQRELLLDTVTQNSPVALLLVDQYQRIVYANLAARHEFGAGRILLGEDFVKLLQSSPEPFRTAVQASGDSLFSIRADGSMETFHLSQRAFTLQRRPHKLYLFKRLTRELSRQEVATWKKLIRVLSHELNNSLAPIASLAQSGVEVARRGETAELDEIFAGIGERADHLHRFISSYATFARLPAPQPGPIDWAGFVGTLSRQHPCRIAGELPAEAGWFDRSQIEQALINLLKNAHEAGSPPESIELAIACVGPEQRIEVRDRGPGMSEAVLAQALLPFYSTKRTGTGLGLALSREIAEAHGGQIRLCNREGGGVGVALILPRRPPA